MTTKQKTLVFDLDGTLVDSIRDLVPALNHSTALEGLPPVSTDDVGHVVGLGAVKMLELIFKLNNHTVSKSRQKELFARFLDYYEENISENTIFFDGTLKALDVLAAEGWILAICTNKYERFARKLLGEMGELERFPVITGGDTFSVKKPDPGHILKTIEFAGGDPSKSIMVGDSINDIAAAQAASVPTIAVDFGYTDIPVQDMKPNAIISHFDELPKAVNSIYPNLN